MACEFPWPEKAEKKKRNSDWSRGHYKSPAPPGNRDPESKSSQAAGDGFRREAHTCIHIANLFYLASFLCRDILWLRVLICAGLVFGIVFFCSHSESMFMSAGWMAVFLVVNCIQIARILRDRRDMELSPEQKEMGRLLLQRLSRADMLNILTKSMCDSDRNSTLLEQSGGIELNQEQQFVRDVAFDRLSDQELMNLIIRRFWPSIRRRKPGWFKAVPSQYGLPQNPLGLDAGFWQSLGAARRAE